jgi:hypothetical protein
MIPFNLHKTLIFRALKRPKVWEDAEDAVQNAYLLYLRYQNKLDTSNPEKLINWLVDQEVIRIWKKNNGITSRGKNHGKILKFADISTLDMAPEEEIVSRALYVAYNEGEARYDLRLLKGKESLPYAKSEYLGESYASKEFVLTEIHQKTKYGTYVRISRTSGHPKVSKQVRCYKFKG